MTNILKDVWGMDFDPGSNLVDVQVNRLRKKLEIADVPVRIETMRGTGFCLRTPFHGLAQQFLDILSRLRFEMAEVLVAGHNQALNGLFQRARRTGSQHGQRFARGSRYTVRACSFKAGRCHVLSLYHPARN